VSGAGAHRPPSGYDKGPGGYRAPGMPRAAMPGMYDARVDMPRGLGPDVRQPMLPGQYAPPGPIRPPRMSQRKASCIACRDLCVHTWIAWVCF
jgi:hypothetical protein